MPPVLCENSKALNAYFACTIQSIEEFKNVKEIWQDFVQEYAESNICLSYDWILAHLEHFPPLYPFIIMVYDDSKKLAAIAPFKITRSTSGAGCRFLRRMQFIGTDPSVYDSIYIPCKNKEKQEYILQIIANRISSESEHWDLIDLRYLKDLDQAEILYNLLKPVGFKGEIFSTMNNPFCTLPDNLQDYEESRKKSQKKNIRNIMNRVRHDYPSSTPIVEFITLCPLYDQLMDIFVEKHLHYWQERGFKSDFERFPKLRSFYKTIHQHYNSHNNNKQHSLFSVLKIGEQIVSYQICFWQGNNTIGHLTTYHPEYKKYSPGLLHTDALIQETISRQGKFFNFGRGNETYKGQWADQYHLLWDLVLFKSKWAYISWQGDKVLKQLV